MLLSSITRPAQQELALMETLAEFMPDATEEELVAEYYRLLREIDPDL